MIDSSPEDERSLELHQQASSKESHLDSDEEINKAYEESVKEESILPILKQELWLKIQTRRLSEGQEELKPEISEPKLYKLTEEEKEKNRRRLEQNRDSLRRSRTKEFEHEARLRMLTEEEKEKNRRRLEQNRDYLRRSRNKEFEHEARLRMNYNIESSKKEMLQRQKEELLKEKENVLKRLHNAGLEFNENTSTMTCQICKKTHIFSSR